MKRPAAKTSGVMAKVKKGPIATKGASTPTISHEASRSQFLLRTGEKGPGANFIYKYGANGVSKAEAKSQAEAKMKSAMKGKK